MQELVDDLSLQDVYCFGVVSRTVGELPLFFKPSQRDVDKGTILLGLFVAADNTAFSRAIGACECDIADIITGKYIIQSFLIMAEIDRITRACLKNKYCTNRW